MQTNQYLYPEPPSLLSKLSLRNIMRYVGPGVILASVTIGAGELVMASRSGAIFGYALMWCFLFAGIAKGIQVYSSARYYVLTGEHPMIGWRDLPGPPLWFPLLITLPLFFITPLIFTNLPELLATFVNHLVQMPREGPPIGIYQYEEFYLNFWATLILSGCLAMALWSSHNWFERISSFILGTLVGTIAITAFAFGPDLLGIFQGIFIPVVPVYPAWIGEIPQYRSIFERNPWLEVAIYLTAVGGGAPAYVGYVGMMREKKWGLAGLKNPSKEEMESSWKNGEELRRARLWLRAPLIDTTASFVCVITVTLLFVIQGAQVLHPRQLIPDGSDFLTVQANYLTLLNPNLAILYRIGVFFAFIGTIYGAFTMLRHTFAECLTSLFPKWAPERASPKWRKWVYTYGFLSGLLLTWLPQTVAGDIIGRSTIGSLVSGATTGGLWCFAMLWLDHKKVPRAMQMGPMLKIGVWLAGFLLFGLGLKTIHSYFFG